MKVGRNSRCLNIQVFGASLGHWKIWKQGLLRFQSLLSLLLHFQETHESHEQQALYSLPESTFYRVPPPHISACSIFDEFIASTS
jgi:hypothetical protein